MEAAMQYVGMSGSLSQKKLRNMYLCIYMHRESGSDYEVDPIVRLIWSKLCITIYITIFITKV